MATSLGYEGAHEVGRGDDMNAGARQETAPSGVVTFLFTDIEGSTRRWESDADAMRTALAAHDEALRDSRLRLATVSCQPHHDGVVAAITSPIAAVEAAVGAQRELELLVRMGLATGEAELREGRQPRHYRNVAHLSREQILSTGV